VSLVALFGYFNSVHIYQIFRLINGASIGVGVVVYLMQKMYVSANTGIRTVIVASAVALCCLWSRNFLFKATSSVYLPWDLKMLVRKPVARNDIPMFHGKRVSGEYYGFYEEVLATLSKFDRSYYVINYSWDPLLTVLANLKRVQIMPFYLDPPYYLPFEKYGYRNEATKIAQVIASKRAIILEMAHPPGAVGEGSKGKEPGKIAGYKLVFAKPWSLDTAWFGSPGMKLYISVPEETNGVPGAEYLRGKGAVANP
jgi:hypothetical protein